MAKSKLPKGAQSLGDIARMRGRGGYLLVDIRRVENPLVGFSEETPAGRRFRRLSMLPEKQAAAEEMYVEQQEAAYRKPSVVNPVKVSDISTASLTGSMGSRHRQYMDLFRASKIRALARKAGKIGGRVGGKLGALGTIPLPSQIEEYQEMMKPLHKREQEASARRM